MAKNFTLFSIDSFSEGLPSDSAQASVTSREKETLSYGAVPGDEIIKNILGFSKALEVEQSRSIGSVEMILNWASFPYFLLISPYDFIKDKFIFVSLIYPYEWKIDCLWSIAIRYGRAPGKMPLG